MPIQQKSQSRTRYILGLVHGYAKYAYPMLAYMLIYCIWFNLLENWNRLRYVVVHMTLDDYIPFCEIFVVPYFLWFAYMIYTVCYMYVKDRETYHSLCAFLCIGMTLFLVLSTLIPNIQFLRPQVMPRDNIFTRMVQYLYRTDTPTNLFPSIHVYNTVGAMIAVEKSKGALTNKKWVRITSAVLGVSIILATMFIKQHSVFDVSFALLFSVPIYILVYRFGFTFERRRSKSRRERKTVLE